MPLCKNGQCTPIYLCNISSVDVGKGVATDQQKAPLQGDNRTYNIDLRYSSAVEEHSNDDCPLNEVCCVPKNQMNEQITADRGEQCGIRNVKGVGYRISTGEETEFGKNCIKYVHLCSAVYHFYNVRNCFIFKTIFDLHQYTNNCMMM